METKFLEEYCYTADNTAWDCFSIKNYIKDHPQKELECQNKERIFVVEMLKWHLNYVDIPLYHHHASLIPIYFPFCSFLLRCSVQSTRNWFWGRGERGCASSPLAVPVWTVVITSPFSTHDYTSCQVPLVVGFWLHHA